MFPRTVTVRALHQILYAWGPGFYVQEASDFLHTWGVRLSTCRRRQTFYAGGLKIFTCMRRQAFHMPEAFEFICMRPSAYAKGSLGSQSYQIGLQLGIFVISKRRQNCVELVKCTPDLLKAFREDQGFLERGKWLEKDVVGQLEDLMPSWRLLGLLFSAYKGYQWSSRTW